MTTKKVSELDAASALADGDLLLLVDVSDTTSDAAGTSKRVTLAALESWLQTAGALQPLDSDLTAIAALSTTSFGRALLELADAAAARTALALATVAATGSASDLSSGTVATARLGSGSASSSTYLRGDGSWQAIPSSVGGVLYLHANYV